VTLCIAEKCQHAGEPQVVCCFDAQVGDDYSASESAYKFKQLSNQAVAMYSGPLILAGDLISDYEDALRDEALTRQAYRDRLWVPMKSHLDKMEKSAEFLPGQDQPQLLIVLILEKEFRLVTVDEHGISESPFFAAIGSGSDSAIAMLRWRRADALTPMNTAIYYAYEAKRLGEVSPHVGKFTYVRIVKPILDWTIGNTIVRPTGIAKLAEAFTLFGPQPIEPFWHLSDEDMV